MSGMNAELAGMMEGASLIGHQSLGQANDNGAISLAYAEPDIARTVMHAVAHEAGIPFDIAQSGMDAISAAQSHGVAAMANIVSEAIQPIQDHVALADSQDLQTLSVGPAPSGRGPRGLS